MRIIKPQVHLHGYPIPSSSGGGSDTSNLRWDGKKPDEDEEMYRKRCLIAAIGLVKKQNKQKYMRR